LPQGIGDWAPLMLVILGMLVLLGTRQLAKPAAEPSIYVVSASQDWSDRSFGLDLIVAALIAAPAVLAARLQVSDHLGIVKDQFPAEAKVPKDLIGRFFHASNSDAAATVMLLIFTTFLCLVGYMAVVRKYKGYDARVPIGCAHPSLRLWAFLFESGVGICVSVGTILVAASVMK